MRKISDELKGFISELKVEPQTNENIIKQTRHYRLITPLFGGGVEAKVTDPIKVIRETSIRGQLRFWWRAMRGVGTLVQMKRREGEIFGSAGGTGEPQPSQVLIFVKVENAGQPDEPFEIDRGRPKPRRGTVAPFYAAFPLQPSNEEARENPNRKMEEVLVGVQFTLEISYPQNWQAEIEAALWAWETFGGVGGRTRRGFGAIQRDDETSPQASEVENLIRRKLAEHLAVGDWDVNAQFPHLTAGVNFSLTNKFNQAHANNYLIAWQHLIQKLHDFRQSPRVGNIYKGESDWSEPDAIRDITGRHAFDRTRGIAYRQPTHPVGLRRKFPRAQFGLPIIFKFKDDGDGDPLPHTLKPQSYERLSSPLILRPIACANGESVGLALILNNPPLPDVELIEPQPGGRVVSRGMVITDLDPADIPNIAPMVRASAAETNVLKSFLKTI